MVRQGPIHRLLLAEDSYVLFFSQYVVAKNRVRRHRPDSNNSRSGTILTICIVYQYSTIGVLRYMGVTPSRLLDKMEAVKTQAAMGVFAAAPMGVGSVRVSREGQKGPFAGGISSLKTGEIFVSSQETGYRGHILGKSAVHTALRT